MEKSHLMTSQSNKLVLYGMILFLLGLLIGLMVPAVANPRMGLAAHMQGITNGIFLIVMGLIWHKIAISDRLLKTSYWLVLYGTFANLAAVFISAVYDVGSMMPIAGGKSEDIVFDSLVTFMLITLGISMLIVSILVIYGLFINLKGAE